MTSETLPGLWKALLKSSPSIAKVLTRLSVMLASEADSLTPADPLQARSGKATCPGTCPGV